VVVDASARISVKVGDRVQGGASVLAYLQGERELATAGIAASAGNTAGSAAQKTY
jgi:hypothetical protein